MIDLHTHTTESDGTLTPADLIQAAVQMGLDALAISDHDTLAGHDRAAAPARQAGLDLVCAVEISTRLSRPGQRATSVHLLGYFLQGPPDSEFRAWLEAIARKRRERNARMAARLEELGVGVTLEEVVALGGSIAGRPHFARLMLQKGRVASLQEAFDRYIGEAAPAYVERDEPGVAEGIRRILEAGGLPCLSHPIRLSKGNLEAIGELVAGMCEQGLRGLEVHYSEHNPAQTQFFLELARRYRLAVSGGSDFHGDNKPGVSLGTGIEGNLNVPLSVLEELRRVG
ncbi:MAG: PHP domain-containing protein [Acidobacteriota bacterium]